MGAARCSIGLGGLPGGFGEASAPGGRGEGMSAWNCQQVDRFPGTCRPPDQAAMPVSQTRPPSRCQPEGHGRREDCYPEEGPTNPVRLAGEMLRQMREDGARQKQQRVRQNNSFRLRRHQGAAPPREISEKVTGGDLYLMRLAGAVVLPPSSRATSRSRCHHGTKRASAPAPSVAACRCAAHQWLFSFPTAASQGAP